MKKKWVLFAVVGVLIAGGPGCLKSKAKHITLEVALKANDSYQYNLGGFGDEEGAGITKQAKHYRVSETTHDTTGLAIIYYNYTPAANYTGTDEVELRSARGSDGSSYNPYKTYTHIKFTITN